MVGVAELRHAGGAPVSDVRTLRELLMHPALRKAIYEGSAVDSMARRIYQLLVEKTK